MPRFPLEYFRMKGISDNRFPAPHGHAPRVNPGRRGNLRVALASIGAITAAVLLVSALPAAAVDVSFDVQPQQMNLGETARASLTFHGARNMGGIELPAIDGLSITPPSVMQQNINGAHSVRMDYRIFPQKAGSFVIGPYELNLEGEKLRIPEARIEVRAPDGDPSPRDMIFTRLQLPETPPYVHQVFDVTLKLYFLPTVNLAREVSLLGGFPETGFVIGGFEELQMTREEIDGRFYNVRRFRSRARALTAGSFTLSPALRAGVVDRNTQNQRRRDPFFGGFFEDPFSRPSATPVTAAAPPQTLVVRNIPQEGRPPSFSGAVGRFDFAVDVKPRELQAGEPVTVNLRLQGVGNIGAARPPAYRDTDLYRAYEPRLVGDAPDPTAERGAKTFDQVVIPRSADLTELPALRFAYFDPEAGQYRTLAAGPFPLTVHPSENGESSLMLQIPGANGGGGKALVLGTDIVYLKPSPTRWRSPAPAPLRTAVKVGAHAAAPLLLAGLFVFARRRNQLAADTALARRRTAPRSARAGLRRAETAARGSADPAEVFKPLADAVTGYFGHRLNLPPGAVDSSLILDKLQAAGTDPSDLEAWREFFALSDRILYATPPELSREDLSRWIATLTALLRKAERSKL